MRFLRGGRGPLVALLAVVVTALAVLPAGATVAGTNGQIAFARQLPAGGADVFIANPDGEHAQQVPLVYPAEDFGIPRWSPDSSQLLISHVLRFDASGNLLPFRPATVRPDGSGFNLLEPPNGPFDMDCPGGWYPNGTRLLCGFGGDQPGVFSIRASDGSDPVRLTTYPFGPNCNACDQAADVSPDGSRFVFLRYRNENTNHQQVALFVENINGTGLRQLTPYGLAQPHEIASARWSPDGQDIISETTQGTLFVVHPDGPGLSMIRLHTGTTRYFAFEPSWSPDGTQIVFCMSINGQEDIYTANADGSNVKQVTDTPDFENGPDWGTHPLAR
jgi:Tol biopolymer transport system component